MAPAYLRAAPIAATSRSKVMEYPVGAIFEK